MGVCQGRMLSFFRKKGIRAAVSVLSVLFLAVSFPSEAREGIHQNYELEKVVIFSRHNLRSPMSTDEDKRSSMTPHRWRKPEGAPGDLSNRGGILETMMGESVKDYLDREHFAPVQSRTSHFYSDSDERTIATARFFAAGVAPLEQISISHRPQGEKDPVFASALPENLSDSALEELKQEENVWRSRFLAERGEKLGSDFKEMERVLDISLSPAARQGQFRGFDPYDCRVQLEKGKKPKLSGSLKTAHSLADSLLIQYYETEDDRKAAFGHAMTFKDWEKIGDLKDDFGLLLYGMPQSARLMAGPLLSAIRNEMEGTVPFSYICGHDSNISLILASLGTLPYELPGSLEKKVPFGVKIFIEKWKGEDRKEYGTISLLYYRTDQIRHLQVPGKDSLPAVYPLRFQGTAVNEDGMMLWADVVKLFDRASD